MLNNTKAVGMAASFASRLIREGHDVALALHISSKYYNVPPAEITAKQKERIAYKRDMEQIGRDLARKRDLAAEVIRKQCEIEQMITVTEIFNFEYVALVSEAIATQLEATK